MMLRPWMQDTIHSISAASLALVLEGTKSNLGERWEVIHTELHMLQTLSVHPLPCKGIQRQRRLSTLFCALWTHPADWSVLYGLTHLMIMQGTYFFLWPSEAVLTSELRCLHLAWVFGTLTEGMVFHPQRYYTARLMVVPGDAHAQRTYGDGGISSVGAWLMDSQLLL